MQFIRFFIIILGLFSASLAFSQISHGGKPFFLQPSIMRATSGSFFVEMPAFDLDSVLREDAINEENMRGSYRFAHKFYTHIDSKNIAKTVLPDGTSVKQIGIRSAGAYSINLLLRDFEIPPGGKIFVYSADHSYVAGSFDYRNNSQEKTLPIQPVAGESIIVEYSEPADVLFTGHFVIAEVNHDYRNFFKVEPGIDHSQDYDCMPDVFCDDVAEETIRSTVLLIINGNTFCSGSLLNNTSDDGRPYLLTAVHCLCSPRDFPKGMDYYNERAATIVAFFNYNRPVCDTNLKMKGSEEMSLAGAYARMILEKKDIALLEFLDLPPEYFNVYYAGWQSDLTETSSIHTNVHHPRGAVKKYGITDGDIQIISLPPPDGNLLDANSFWGVPYWTVGSTYGGSSGSPLFDENQLLIGGLTGGSSHCIGTEPDGKPDYFFALGKGWETDDPDNQLKTYLNPGKKDVLKYPGMDPNRVNPVMLLANVRYNEGDSLITSELNTPNRGFVFGNSNLRTLEFAEEFSVEHPLEIFGAYLLIPAMQYNYTSGVVVSVYTGDSSPETKIYSTPFIPRYLNYTTSTGFYQTNKNLNLAPTETFVLFNEPVQVKSKKFFISYSIDYSLTSQFCVFNTKRKNNSLPNTAWLKDETKGWVPAETYEFQSMKTSLAIHSLIRNIEGDKIEIIPAPGDNGFYYNRSEKVLFLKKPLDKQGQISIHLISGQLLEKMYIQPDQTSIMVSEQPKGTIGIVKITSNNFSCTGKIIY